MISWNRSDDAIERGLVVSSQKYHVDNHSERFTYDGSRCTLHLNCFLHICDYIDVEADTFRICSLYVSQQFTHYKIGDEGHNDEGVINLPIEYISATKWRVHICLAGFPLIFLDTCHAILQLRMYDCTELVSVTCIGGHVNHAGQERSKVNQLVGGTDKLFIDVFTNTGDTNKKYMHRTSLR